MKKGIVFFAGVEVEGDLYFSDHLRNAIFKQNGKTKKITYIGSVKEESLEGGLYFKAIHYKSWIYFLPSWGNSIARLNLDDYDICVISLPESNHICNINKFIDVVVRDKDVWLIPIGYDALLQLNMETGDVKRYADWPIGVQWKHEKFMMFSKGVCVSNILCMCPLDGEQFITFDLEEKVMKAWEWKYPSKAFCGMIHHKDTIWFLPRREYPYIIKYSLHNGTTKQIEVDERVEDNIVALYATAILMGDMIVCVPYECKQWLIINTLTDEVKKEPFVDSRMKNKDEKPYYQFTTVLGNGVQVSGDNQRGAHLISEDPLDVCEIDYKVDDLELLKYLIDKNQIDKIISNKKEDFLSNGESIFYKLK